MIVAVPDITVAADFCHYRIVAVSDGSITGDVSDGGMIGIPNNLCMNRKGHTRHHDNKQDLFHTHE
jgi:hypothetical protein